MPYQKYNFQIFFSSLLTVFFFNFLVPFELQIFVILMMISLSFFPFVASAFDVV